MGRPYYSDDMLGHPREPEGFSFTQTRTGPDGWVQVIKSHIAYDSRWPWWRRTWANLRKRP